jgi:N-acetylneuraminate synthase
MSGNSKYTQHIGKKYMAQVIAEIGINHNGDLSTCLSMIKAAKDAGADFVKFQKRDPDVCVPEHQKNVMRSTPWGEMTYLDYKYRIEFNYDDYCVIDDYCKQIGIGWFVSVWDLNSVDFIKQFNTDIVKIPSAKATDHKLVAACRDSFNEVILSTGMCKPGEIKATMELFQDRSNIALMHCVSAYPVSEDVLVMDTIDWLSETFGHPVGYSSHEKSIVTAAATVYKGVKYIERHFTLDNNMWGTDQKASSDPEEMTALVNTIRLLESTLGRRVGVIECEQENLKKMR